MSSLFRLKTKPEIVADMRATLRSLEGDEVDLSENSVLSSLIEMAALSDAEIYVQLSKLLDLFSLDHLRGDDLDRFAYLLGASMFPAMRRLPARTSLVMVRVGDGSQYVSTTFAANVVASAASFSVQPDGGTAFPSAGAAILEQGTEREETIIFTRIGDVFTVVSPATGVAFAHAAGGEVVRIATKSLLSASYLAGVTSVVVTAGTGPAWPTSGSIIFERGTARAETITFTRVADTFTLGGATAFAHAIDTDVILSTFGSNRSIAVGSQPVSPLTDNSKLVSFRTTEAGTLLDGDLFTSLIEAESDEVGEETRVGSSTVTAWVSAPFANATVTNPLPATRGANREKDAAYVRRLRSFLLSLTRGTPTALEFLIIGVRDEVSNQEVGFSQLVEAVVPGLSTLYITDGSASFAIEQEVFTGRDVLISVAETGDKRGKLGRYAPFKKVASPAAEITPRIYQSNERGVATSVGVNYLEDTTKSLTVNAHVGMYLKTDDNQFYLITANTAIRYTVSAAGGTPSLGSYSVLDFSVDPLIPGTDYYFREDTGDLELLNGLVENDSLVAASDGAAADVGAYTFSKGLGATAQRTVNGDRNAIDDFPGIRLAGQKVLIAAPTIVSPSFVIQVLGTNTTDEELRTTVQSLVSAYVNGLGIGENIIISEIIKLVKELPYVTDVHVLTPSANYTVAAGQLPRITNDMTEVL